jgi:porin
VTEAAWLTRPSTAGDPADQSFRIGRSSSRFAYDDKIAVGAWYYTASFNDLDSANPAVDPRQHHGEWGSYLLLDRLLFRSRTNPKQRLTGFLQLGIADPAVDRFAVYVGTGVAFSGFLPSRPDDKFGLGVAMARNSPSYIAGQQQAGLPQDAAETTVELNYLIRVASRFALQPDVQYVIHPNTNPQLHDATVVQLRFEFSL